MLLLQYSVQSLSLCQGEERFAQAFESLTADFSYGVSEAFLVPDITAERVEKLMCAGSQTLILSHLKPRL